MQEAAAWMTPSHLVKIAGKVCLSSGSATNWGGKNVLIAFSRTPTSDIELFVVAQEVGGRLYCLPFSRTPTSDIESFVEEQ